jgi:hypothetical protein
MISELHALGSLYREASCEVGGVPRNQEKAAWNGIWSRRRRWVKVKLISYCGLKVWHLYLIGQGCECSKHFVVELNDLI